jgi:signal peptidase I
MVLQRRPNAGARRVGWFRKRWLLIPFLAMLGCTGNWNSGDRVLVAKCLYETKIKEPERYDVVVFKFPSEPVKRGVPTNYIKRLLGLPGEILAIFFGQLFRTTPEPGVPVPGSREDKGDATSLWMLEKQPDAHEFGPYARAAFEAGKFEIVRKPPTVMMAMRRIVYDNNHQASDLKDLTPRWNPRTGSAWSTSADRRTFKFTPTEAKDAKNAAGDDADWLTYQHLLRPAPPIVANAKLQPQLITDFLGYNAYNVEPNLVSDSGNWVGSLMLEANVTVNSPTGEFHMELSRGRDRFRAKWEVASGECTLLRIRDDGKTEELRKESTTLKGTGTHLVRFANFDARLSVWVDRELPFGDGVGYDPLELPAKGEKITLDDIKARCGPYDKNDLMRPASLGGSKGASITVADLRLWRDTYYQSDVHSLDVSIPESHKPNFIYVYPGHYLCLGDNSTSSSDGRQWGLVPERLMLGRALAVYWPLHRAGLIR